MLKLNIIMGKNKTPNKPKLKNTAQPPASALQKGQGHDRERQPEDLPQIRGEARRQDTEVHDALVGIPGWKTDTLNPDDICASARTAAAMLRP